MSGSEPALEGPCGLSPDDARRRFEREGANELPTQGSRSFLRTVLDVAREPMLAMLVVAGALYLWIGETSDALTLLAFVFVVIAITIVQERRTERALDALRDLSSPRALVVRESRRTRIPGREVVRGDIVVLAEGDRIPADAILRRGAHLSVDESLLTGESAPVQKCASGSVSALERPGGEGLASVFSGTLVTAGEGLAEVFATGPHSELGRIGRALRETRVEPTPLQSETRSFVRRVALVGLALSAAVVLIYGSSRGGSMLAWKQGALAGIALAMALLPEEFPVVLTVYLALGSWRLSRHGVLARRMPAVEALGSATVLCTDKTGTLTQNQMALVALVAGGETLDPRDRRELSAEMRVLLETARRASKTEPFDPMERAIHDESLRFPASDASVRSAPAVGTSSSRATVADGDPAAAATLVREFPLSPDLFALTHIWRRAGTEMLDVASKGAPEAVAELCRLTAPQRAAVLADCARLAGAGRRVLAVARGTIDADRIPDRQAGFELEFLGLLGFEDPLRPSVPAAVAECRRAGIRVVMVTGDHPITAQVIARGAGLERPDAIMTGTELAQLTDAELVKRISSVRVFARVVPEQKLRIVNALIVSGEIVAMTGDGVNDAPALKAAHIGVALGGRGTDVAREAAGLVILDDDFSSIVTAVRMGRRIFDNIREAMIFIVAVHVPIAGLALLQVLVPSAPLLLLPVHIAFLELVIDPACSLVFEAEEAEDGIMDRPPRRRGAPLFDRSMLEIAAVQGLSVLAACVAIFFFARRQHDPDVARALTFTTLVVGFVVTVLTNRSRTRPVYARSQRPNRAAWALVGATLVMLAVVLFVPAARRLLSFAPVHVDDLALALGLGVLCLAWFEALKFVRTSRERKAASLHA